MFESKLKEYYLSKKSHTEKPKECSWTDALKYMRTHYNFCDTQLLKDVDLWDYKGCSQMRSISTFVCHICDFKIQRFQSWLHHIMSKKHLSKSETKVDIYSYACYGCKILMYGSSAKIKLHRINKHDDKSDLPAISYLMANLMNEPGIHWYFCTHCNKFAKSLTEIHPFDPKHYPNEILYDCKYCDVTLLSSNEVLDCHSLSVEHTTLKCMYFIKKAVNEKEIELGKKLKKHTEIQVADITKCEKTERVLRSTTLKNRQLLENKNSVISNSKVELSGSTVINKKIIKEMKSIMSKKLKLKNKRRLKKERKLKKLAEIKECLPPINLKLPLIILNRFQNISQVRVKCKLCYIRFDLCTENIIRHVLTVCIKPDGFPKYFFYTCPTINIYDCRVCDRKAYSFLVYLYHVISLKHLSNCLINDDLYSYFCSPCSLYIYGSINSIADHCKTTHHVESFELPTKYKFLADKYKYISNEPEYESKQLCCHLPEEKLGENNLHPVQYQCNICRLDFGEYLCDYKYHMLSSEHIILKYFTLNTTSMMNTCSTVDMENLDPTIYCQCSKHIDDEENLQEVNRVPKKKLHSQPNPIGMDDAFGLYVAQRLKNIHDASTKNDIKLEIDFLFCNKMVQPTKGSIND